VVVDMVDKFNDPRDAGAKIVNEWLEYDISSDDITVIFVQINSSHNYVYNW